MMSTEDSVGISKCIRYYISHELHMMYDTIRNKFVLDSYI